MKRNKLGRETMRKTKPSYGWYSKKEATRTGELFIFHSADGGEKVTCSSVTSTPITSSGWDDITSVGRVGECTDLVRYYPEP